MAKHKEVWRPAPGFPDYLVSSKGRIKSLLSRRLLKQSLDGYGYPQIGLRISGQLKVVKVHRLVMLAFGRLQVNHINGIKTDNRIKNLEFVTASQNMKHAHTLKTRRPKRTIAQILKDGDEYYGNL